MSPAHRRPWVSSPWFLMRSRDWPRWRSRAPSFPARRVLARPGRAVRDHGPHVSHLAEISRRKGVATALGSFFAACARYPAGDAGDLCCRRAGVSLRLSGLDRDGRALSRAGLAVCTTMPDAPQILGFMAIASLLIIARHHQKSVGFWPAPNLAFNGDADEPDRHHRRGRMGHGPRHRAGTQRPIACASGPTRKKSANRSRPAA